MATTEQAATLPPESETPPKFTEATARAGYDELVRVLMRRRDGPLAPGHGGVAYIGSPKHPLLGMTLDTATPVFVNPYALRNRVLFVLGDPGSGVHFAADMLAARTRWCFGKTATVEVPDESNWIDHFPNREDPSEWVPKRGRRIPRPHALILPGHSYDDPDPLKRIGAVRQRRRARALPTEIPFEGVILRHTPSDPLAAAFNLSKATREWLPKARTPDVAGYAEGIYCLPYGILPIALVASTPEYEWLTLKHGSATRPTDPKPGG